MLFKPPIGAIPGTVQLQRPNRSPCAVSQGYKTMTPSAVPKGAKRKAIIKRTKKVRDLFE